MTCLHNKRESLRRLCSHVSLLLARGSFFGEGSVRWRENLSVLGDEKIVGIGGCAGTRCPPNQAKAPSFFIHDVRRLGISVP